MNTKAGVGVSNHRDPYVAGKEAAREAIANGGIERPDFVFMFATVGYDQQAIVKAVRAATGRAPMCGCSGEGIIAKNQADESNFAVAVMTISSDEIHFHHGIATGLKTDSEAVGRIIAQSIQAFLNSDSNALFMFPDGITLNFDRLLMGIEGQINYDRFLPIMGGLSGDNWQLKQAYQYWNDDITSDGVAWVLLSGKVEIVSAVNHGCIPIGIEYKVTRAAGNIIYEIDHKPVLEVLKDFLTDDEIADWGKVINNLALGFEAPRDMHGYDQYVIRNMPAKDDKAKSVMVVTEVTEGTSIWMARRDYDKVVAGIDWLARQIRDQLGNHSPKFIFQFDCAGRGKVFLRDQIKLQLLNRLQQQLPDVPYLGFYTFGEIGPVGMKNYFHNYTAVVTAIF